MMSESHLLSYAHIEGAFCKALLKSVHACTAAHGSVNAHDTHVPFRLRYQGVCKVVGVRAGLHVIDSILHKLHLGQHSMRRKGMKNECEEH